MFDFKKQPRGLYPIFFLAVIVWSLLDKRSISHASSNSSHECISNRIQETDDQSILEIKLKIIEEEITNFVLFVCEKKKLLPQIILNHSQLLEPISIPDEQATLTLAAELSQNLHNIDRLIRFNTATQFSIASELLAEIISIIASRERQHNLSLKMIKIQDFGSLNKSFAILALLYFFANIKDFYHDTHLGDTLRSLLAQIEKVDHNLEPHLLKKLQDIATRQSGMASKEEFFIFYNEKFLDKFELIFAENFHHHMNQSLIRFLGGECIYSAMKGNFITNFSFSSSDLKPGLISEKTQKQMIKLAATQSASLVNNKVEHLRKIGTKLSQREQKKQVEKFQLRKAKAKDLFQFFTFLQMQKKIKLNAIQRLSDKDYNAYYEEFTLFSVLEAERVFKAENSKLQGKSQLKKGDKDASQNKEKRRPSKAKSPQFSPDKREPSLSTEAINIEDSSESLTFPVSSPSSEAESTFKWFTNINKSNPRISYHDRVKRWRAATIEDVSTWPSYTHIENEEELQYQILAHTPAALSRFLTQPLQVSKRYCLIEESVHERWGQVRKLKFPAIMHFETHHLLGLISISASMQAHGKFLVYHAMFKEAKDDKEWLAALEENDHLEEIANALVAAQEQDDWESTGMFSLTETGELRLDVKSQKVKYTLIKFRD